MVGRHRLEAGRGGQLQLERSRRRLRRDPQVSALVKSVAVERQVPLYQLLSTERGPAAAAHARQVAMYLVHVLLGRPQDVVGEIFGRQRTTVQHACRTVEDLRDVRAVDEQIERIETRFARALSVAEHGNAL